MSEEPQVATEATPPKKWTRDEIRAQIFNAKPNIKEGLTLFGAPIVLKEPPMQVVMDLQALEDKQQQTAQMLATYVFTPDGEQVFEMEDAEAIVALPFGKDMQKVISEITALMGVAPTPDAKSPTAA